MGSIVWAAQSRRSGVVNWNQASPRSCPLSIHIGVNLDRVPRRYIGNPYLLSGKPTRAIDIGRQPGFARACRSRRAIARLAKQQAKEGQEQTPAASRPSGN